MKIVGARPLGKMAVYDLSVDHPSHSFVHEAGVVLHNCGHVLANQPISNWIPLITVGDVRVTSFNAPAVEAVGGVKMDFLTVTAIRDVGEAIRIIQARHGVPDCNVPVHHRVPHPLTKEGLDIWDLPQDQGVYDDIANGKTETVFQVNTSGAQQWLHYFRGRRPDGTALISSLRDLAVFTALDRPGPLNIELTNPDTGGKHNALVEYTRRAKGLPGSRDIHPIMDRLIPETYGILVFQESLQKLYQELTGCTGAEAEEFRGNVAKKKHELVNAAYPGFVAASVGRGLTTEEADKLWEGIKTWAEYGFNKSHAASYGVTIYATAWLKHHYPLEWWCAVLRNADKDKIGTTFWPFIHKFVALPDVGLSGSNWEIVGDKLQAPLTLMRGMGEKTHDQVISYAPYKTVDDLARAIQLHREAGRSDDGKAGRSSLNRSVVWNMITAGACDSLFADQPYLDEPGKMALFDEAVERVCDPTYIKSYRTARRKNPLPILDPIGRYQARKAVLAPYGTDLRPMVARLDPMPPCLTVRGQRMVYLSRNRGREYEVPVLGYAGFRDLANAAELPSGGYRCSVVAYVDEIRNFRYGPSKSREAMELILDVGGDVFKVVQWGGEKGLSPESKALKAGAVIAAMVTRTDPAFGFGVREFQVIRAPVNGAGKVKNEDGKEQEPAVEE